MRIIGGEARGRRLFAPEGMDTRPTSDRVRESVFNIIRDHVDGAQVLDLFAGSGAMSLEALSRGAQRAVLVDSSRKAAQVISRNVALLRAEARVKLMVDDWQAALSRLRAERFTLVFLDPPYRMVDVYAQAIDRLVAGDLLAEGALLVVEYERGADIALPDSCQWSDQRRYGDTMVGIALVRREEIT